MNLKKSLGIFMTGVMLLSAMPLNVFADEATNDKGILSQDSTVSGSAITVLSNDIDVDFNVTGQWGDGFTGEITLTNISDKMIENWQIEMTFPQEITNIWNATIVSHEDLVYNIRNAGGNNNVNIPVGGSITFGFNGTYTNEITEPLKCKLVSIPETAEEKYYDIDYQVMSDWGSGYTAQITITNKTDEPMEGWHLSFDYARKIDSIWNAVIESNEENHYDISNAGYNSVIPANGSVTFGFIGNNGSLGDEPYNYEFVLTNTAGVVSTPEIIVNEDILGNYKTLADNYIISDTITSVSGELKNKKGVKEFYYIISSRNGEEIERKNIDINSKWIINDINIKDRILSVVLITKEDTAIIKLLTYIDYEYDYKDNDNDGLVNIFEDCYNTDKDVEDTDGDGLPDGYEVWILGTSPILDDTDDNSVSDADEDTDKDGLTNLDEYNIATSPLSSDTDGDTLTDGDEINKFGTDPLNVDTDGDTLNDNDELKLSFDPLVKDTDNNGIDDNDEVIEQTIVQKIDNDEQKAVTSVSVTLACKGNIENSVSIEDMYNKDTLSSGVVGLVGVPVEIQCDQTFNTAEIKFTYDESKLGTTSEDDLAVMWYDEANNKYVVLDESVIDKENNTASYVTTHFSTYLLVDKRVWLDAWRRDSYSTYTPTYYDVAFVLDVSGSMYGVGINKAKTAICTFINALSDKDRGAIISFNYNSYLESGLTYDKNTLLTAAESAAEKTALFGGTNTDKGLYTGLTQLKNNKIDPNRKQIAIMICDGDVNYVQSTVDIAKNNDIQVYTVNVVNSSNRLLEKIASQTHGEYYYAATSNEIGTILDDIQSTTIVSDDSDHDGLKDSWEIEGMQIPNGTIIKTNPDNPDCDGDGMNDGDEMGLYDEEYDYFPNYHSNPNDPDTDDDGCNDNLDLHPKKAARNRNLFEVIDNYNDIPEIMQLNETKAESNAKYATAILANINNTNADKFSERYGQVIATYHSSDDKNKIIGRQYYLMSENKFIYVFNSDYIIKKYSLANSLCAFCDTYYQLNNINAPIKLVRSQRNNTVPIDAVRFLSHFLDNTGDDYTININSLLLESIDAQYYYNEHLSHAIDYARDVVKEGRTVTIATKSEYVAHDKKLTLLDMNWTGALGTCSGVIVAKVTRNNKYKITYKYYVYDYYDWNEMLDAGFILGNLWDSDLAKLHRAGIAREFYVSGNRESSMEVY